MESEKERDIERVYDLAQYVFRTMYGNVSNFGGIPNSYEATLTMVNDSYFNESQLAKANARSWLWQQCNEFGQFITTDFNGGAFWSTVPNDYYIGLCAEAFNGKDHFSYNADDLMEAVKRTKDCYNASREFKGPETMIVLGSVDPWNTVSVNVTTDSSSPIYMVSGVGHNALLKPPLKDDLQMLKVARTLVARKIIKWLRSSTKTNRNSNNQGQLKVEQKHQTISHSKLAAVKNWHGEIVHQPTPGFKPSSLNAIRKRRQYAKYGKMKGVSFQDIFMIKSLSLENSTQLNNLKRRSVNSSYVLQDLDHFDSTNKLKFYQRYLVNTVHQKQVEAPRFLLLGGEAALDWRYVNTEIFAYYQWAADFKAVLYALEHRYYGMSQPFENTTIPSLKWLNSEQAVADAAVFVTTVNKADGLTKPRWVVFGGSYSGNLAAIFRLNYPKLTLGAVASSAPLQATTDFYGFTQVMQSAIQKFGPEGCTGWTRRYFAWIREKINSRVGRTEIKAAFCLYNDWDQNYIDEKDAAFFAAYEMFEIDLYIQYDAGNHWYTGWKCRRMKQFIDIYGAKKTDRAKRLYRAFQNESYAFEKVFNGKASANSGDDYNYKDPDDDSKTDSSSDESSGSGEKDCYWDLCPYGCTWRVYDSWLLSLQDTSGPIYDYLVEKWYGEDRLWFWLTCNQWGFAQSTNIGYNYFESVLPVNYILDVCNDVFGPEYGNRELIESKVRQTNAMYGGQDNYKGTNIVFVNGSEDPWSKLGVPEQSMNANNVTSIWINGTSHCADMFRELKQDTKVLKGARKKIKKSIAQWIKQ